MASIFGHGVLAYSVAQLPPFRQLDARIKWLGVASSMLPDLDVLAFHFGIPYTHMLGHRGLSHSLFFAAIWASLLLRWIPQSNMTPMIRWSYLFMCTASHGVLDACTSGGRGVGFFIPFMSERFFFPWRPILVSPISPTEFFSEWGIRVLQSELIYIGIPSLALIGIGWIAHQFTSPK